MKSKKVYCKNCKYLKYPSISDIYFCCKCIAPTGKIIKDYIHGDYEAKINLYVGDIKYPNKDGECKYYKKKWWRLH